MKRKPRNKIMAFPLAMRLDIGTWLINGKTHDWICARLLEQGVERHSLPLNSSFVAYQAGDEFQGTFRDVTAVSRLEVLPRLVSALLAVGGSQVKILRDGSAKVCRDDGSDLVLIEDLSGFLVNWRITVAKLQE